MSGTGVRKRVRGLGTAIEAIGWVILLGAAALLYFILRSVGTSSLSDPKLWDLLGGVGMLAAIGAGMALWRRGLTVDESAGTVTQWWGFGFPIGRKAYRRATIARVGLVKQIVNTSKGPRIEYWVRLVGMHGEYPPLDRYIIWDHARRDAEAYAKLLRLDLRDESSGEAVVRDAAHLDESLARRHRRLGIPAPVVPQPQGAVARLRYGGAGQTLVIEIPEAELRPSHAGWVLFFPAIGAGAALITYLVDKGDISWPVVFVVLCLFPGVPTLMLLTNLIIIATGRETITVSRSGIDIAWRSRLQRSTRSVSADDIEEITGPAPPAGYTDGADGAAQVFGVQHPSTMVMIQTDRGSVGAGRSLPMSERAWLRSMLVHGIVGDVPAPDTSFLGERSTAFGSPVPAQAGHAAAAHRGRINWLLVLAGTAALTFVAYLSGVPGKKLPWTSGSAESGTPELSGFELSPGPGSGYIRIYGRGAHAEPAGPDLRVVIDEVRLLAVDPRASTTHSSISLSVHRRVDGKWRLVGTAGQKGPESGFGPGGTFSYPGAQAFVIERGAEICRREACSFRLHILGRVGANRPGWDVTDMVPLRLP